MEPDADRSEGSPCRALVERSEATRVRTLESRLGSQSEVEQVRRVSQFWAGEERAYRATRRPHWHPRLPQHPRARDWLISSLTSDHESKQASQHQRAGPNEIHVHPRLPKHGKAYLFVNDGRDERGDHQVAGRMDSDRERSG